VADIKRRGSIRRGDGANKNLPLKKNKKTLDKFKKICYNKDVKKIRDSLVNAHIIEKTPRKKKRTDVTKSFQKSS
jgi:hypothetical protein